MHQVNLSGYMLGLSSFVISLILTPLMRKVAMKLSIMDHPTSEIKSHRYSVPYLGGVAVVSGVAVALLLRFVQVREQVLISSWGLLFPLLGIFLLGTLDDVLGFSARLRFFIQAIIFALFIQIRNLYFPLTGVDWLDKGVTLFWLVGITNAFNIIDIMDGLSSGVAIICGAFLYTLSLSHNVELSMSLSIAVVGSCLGFIGFNFSHRFKIFLGDGGSTLIGALLGIAGVALCANSANPVSSGLVVFVLFGIPIYDTLLVMILRMRRGISPFKGSRDHFALRMVTMGFSNISTVVCAYIISIGLGLVALVMYFSPPHHAILLIAAVGLFALTWGRMLSIVNVRG